jgi:very-short-patch-repair endonuclease
MAGQVAKDLGMARLAGAQHGVASRAQLVDLGLTRDEIDRRASVGRLHAVHRGVYAVGHTVLTTHGRWMAATLATGGALSHATAAAAWDLRPMGGGAIHVTVPGTVGRARRNGVRVHRSTTIVAEDITSHRGIPITTRERTLADLARTLTGRDLEELLDRAEHDIDFGRLRTIAPPSLRAALSRYTAGSTITRSRLEETFLRLCDDHGLPRPEMNVRIEGVTVDAVWRAARLIVEVDGYRYHRGRTVFRTDRERDVRLEVAGWRVLRFTWEHVTERPAWVAGSIRALLAATPTA